MDDPFAGLEADTPPENPIPQSSCVDETQRVSFTTFAKANTVKRRIIEAIEGFEASADLEKYLIAEDIMLDAIYLYNQELGDEIKTAYDDQLAILRGYETTRRVQPPAKGRTVYDGASGAITHG